MRERIDLEWVVGYPRRLDPSRTLLLDLALTVERNRPWPLTVHAAR